MSIEVMSALWARSTRQGSELLVLLALADWADDDGRCWPSVRSIARKARLSERGVQKILARLVDDGDVKVARNRGPHGTNRYVVIVPPNRVHPPEPGSPPQTGQADTNEPPNPVHPPNGVRGERKAVRGEPPFTRTISRTTKPSGGNAASDAAPTNPSPSTADKLTARYVRAFTDHHGGHPPTRTWRNIAGKQFAALLAEGYDPDDLAKVAHAAGSEGKHPGAIPHILADLHAEATA